MNPLIPNQSKRFCYTPASLFSLGEESPFRRPWFKPILRPETGKSALAYVIGVILSDRNLLIHGYDAEMILAVTDHDFVEEFSASLANNSGANLSPTRFVGMRERTDG